MTIRPLQGQVLIYMDTPEAMTGGGLHIPETAQERSESGEVRRLGIWRQDKKGNLVPFPVKPGDRVVIDARSGRWLHGERERLKLVSMESILAIL